jgi:hypothetical protein
MKILLFSIAILVFGCSSEKNSQNETDFLPFSSFNIQILDSNDIFSKNLTKQKLVENIGKMNISDSTELIEEGTVEVNYSKIFANTEKELTLFWNNTGTLKSIKLSNPISKWSINNLKIGMTINEISNENDKDFNFYGFAWDEGGKICDWNNGKFSNFQNGLKVYLLLNFDELTESEIDKLSGDGIKLNSNDVILKKKKIIIDKIEVVF